LHLDLHTFICLFLVLKYNFVHIQVAHLCFLSEILL